MKPTEKDITNIENKLEMEKLAGTLRYIKKNEDKFFSNHFDPSNNPHYEDEVVSAFISTCVTFGGLLYNDYYNEDSKNELEGFVEDLRSSGNEDIAEAFDYIVENKEEFIEEGMEFKNIPNYDYLFSLIMLESVNFGGDWYLERIFDEEEDEDELY